MRTDGPLALPVCRGTEGLSTGVRVANATAASLALLLVWLLEDTDVEPKELSDEEIYDEFLILLQWLLVKSYSALKLFVV